MALPPKFPVSGFDLLETTTDTLAPFANHGGKVVIWQPQTGGPFSPMAMVDWYQKLNLNNGGTASDYSKTQQFARLFMLPGCSALWWRSVDKHHRPVWGARPMGRKGNAAGEDCRHGAGSNALAWENAPTLPVPGIREVQRALEASRARLTLPAP